MADVEQARRDYEASLNHWTRNRPRNRFDPENGSYAVCFWGDEEAIIVKHLECTMRIARTIRVRIDKKSADIELLALTFWRRMDQLCGMLECMENGAFVDLPEEL